MTSNFSKVRQWRIPICDTQLTLRTAEQALKEIAITQDDIPLLVQLVENPRFDIPFIDFFHGATDLTTHDRIHMLLGRGLLPKDEAFVIGFTMGSTDRVTRTEEQLYGLISRFFYPRPYRFSEEDLRVFRDAVRLGYVSDCVPLHSANYEPLLDLPLEQARQALGIETDLLRAYYAIEKRRYPNSFESQRLFDPAKA